MKVAGTLNKMVTEHFQPVRYFLPVGTERIYMNDLLNRALKISWLNEIYCLGCERKTNKSFGQGYCYPCFISVPETDDCVLRPELCRAHEGIARNMDFAQEHCLQQHYVYLALSSEIKVGVTRHSQIPTRWIDQGAWKAVRVAQTPNRYTAGLIEVALKKTFTDKTNWRHMLMDKINNEASLPDKREMLASVLPEMLVPFLFNDDEIIEIFYPGSAVTHKVSSFDIEKHTVLNGTLTGIRGQYLIFDNEKVINIRKYGGYLVEIEC